MKNKPVILIGTAVITCIIIGIFLFNNKKGTTQNNQTQTNNSLFGKKEVKVGNDICGEFPKEWAASALGKPITKTTSLDTTGTHSCQYYTDENNFIILRLNNLSVENQKKGQTTLGRTIITNPKIKMEHFVVIQEDGLINGIYLIVNPNLFLTVDRNSAKAASQEEILNFAIKVSERIQNGENITGAPTSTTQAPVPLPQGEDIVKNFFTLIGEGKIEDAMGMMTPSAVANDSQKQAWAVQFNAFEKITVKKIEPVLENTYKVTLDVQMKPESANAPIPFYGYDNGENIRWVGLEKIDNFWKVTGIATGP